MSNEFHEQLRKWGACAEGQAWAEANAKTAAEAWAKLHRPDWMLWMAEKAGVNLDESKLRLFACDCAEQALPIFERDYPNDPRPRQAIEVTRRYANGQATDEERDAAGAAARDAARAAAWAAARAAAGAAAWAAAGAAAGDAAGAAAWAAARAAAGAYQVDRLRTYFPNPFKEA